MLNSMLTYKIHFGRIIPDLKPEVGLEKKSNRKDVDCREPISSFGPKFCSMPLNPDRCAPSLLSCENQVCLLMVS